MGRWERKFGTEKRQGNKSFVMIVVIRMVYVFGIPVNVWDLGEINAKTHVKMINVYIV